MKTLNASCFKSYHTNYDLIPEGYRKKIGVSQTSIETMPSTQSHFKKLSFGSSGPEISKKKDMEVFWSCRILINFFNFFQTFHSGVQLSSNLKKFHCKNIQILEF